MIDTKMIHHSSLDDLISILGNYDGSQVLITERTVLKHYEGFFNKLANDQKQPLYVLPAGEEAKSFVQYNRLCEDLIERGVTKSTRLVAIGGGATSDIVGFTASTLLRGISWSVVPTTLLSMVDASIGGKTGINSRLGKNLVGSFYLPSEIHYSMDFLKTLDRKFLESGMGEIIKYAFLSEDVYRGITGNSDFSLVIDHCATYKQSIITEDFKEEKGLRVKLNLGHTFGHAIEKVHGLSHGVSVLLGMEAVFNLFEDGDALIKLDKLKGLLSISIPELGSLLNDSIFETMLLDKKRQNEEEMLFVLPDRVVPMGLPEVEAFCKYYNS